MTETETIEQLEILTLDAYILAQILDDLIKYHEEKKKLTSFTLISEMLIENSLKIRGLF